jgi:hypothetical protein
MSSATVIDSAMPSANSSGLDVSLYQPMPDIPLSFAELTYLLYPDSTSGRQTLRATLVTLLAQGILRVEQCQTEVKTLFGTKTTIENYLRIVPARAPTMPPHVAAVLDVVRAAQSSGGKLTDVVTRAKQTFGPTCGFYNGKFIIPPLLERGLFKEKHFLFIPFLRYYVRTRSGKAERLRIKANIAKGRELPKLLASDPTQAVTLAKALGSALLLVKSVTFGHFNQLANAMGTSKTDAVSVADSTGSASPATQFPGDFDVASIDFRSFNGVAVVALDHALKAVAPDNDSSGCAGDMG